MCRNGTRAEENLERRCFLSSSEFLDRRGFETGTAIHTAAVASLAGLVSGKCI